MCQKQPVFRKWIVRAVSVWLIPIQKRSTNVNILYNISLGTKLLLLPS